MQNYAKRKQLQKHFQWKKHVSGLISFSFLCIFADYSKTKVYAQNNSFRILFVFPDNSHICTAITGAMG